MNEKALSKYLSLLLRHKPETIGLQLDPNGWADVNELLSKLKKNGKNISFEQIEAVVLNNDKQRFKLDKTNLRIRANQGHSISVELNLEQKYPPDILYHGTATRHIESIRETGIQKRSRHKVHLSKDLETATKVGQRHGKVIVLLVNAKAMHENGIPFFLSENGVWLTDFVAPEFINFQNYNPEKA